MNCFIAFKDIRAAAKARRAAAAAKAQADDNSLKQLPEIASITAHEAFMQNQGINIAQNPIGYHPSISQEEQNDLQIVTAFLRNRNRNHNTVLTH